MAQLERLAGGPRAVARRTRREGYPEASRGFDLAALALAAWVLLGGYVDGIAHVHGATDDTFFTPFHLLLYSGMLVKGVFLAGAQLRNVSRGHAWLQALPRGYLPSLAGVALMALAGFLDFLWHTAFGIEADIEAALSPPHLLLAFSALVFMSGPLRALWGRAEAQRGWVQLFPAIASALLVVSIFSLFTQVRPRHLLGGAVHAGEVAAGAAARSRADGQGAHPRAADERRAAPAAAALALALRRGDLPAGGQQRPDVPAAR